jgi:hypothetical protein
MGYVLQVLLSAGILGVIITQLHTAWREWQQRKRERNGLLRILFAEVDLNQRLLRVAGALYHMRSAPEERRMAIGWKTLREQRFSMETWEAARVQLAQHLPSEQFAAIASYYSDLMHLKEYVSKSEEPRKSVLGFRDDTREVVEVLHERGRQVEQVIKEYVTDVTTKGITSGDLARREHTRGAELDG